MVCIGPGPGPKNVLAERWDGHQVCVPYAIWKHKLSKETRVSDKTYVTAIGVVQQFGKDKPALAMKAMTNGTVRNFTIQTSNQGYVGVSYWDEFSDADSLIVEGALVGVRGEYTESTGNDGRTYRNVKAITLSVGQTVQRAAREVVNQQAPAAAAAPADAPANPYNL